MRHVVIALIALTLASTARPAHAAWPHDPNVNLRVTETASGGQYGFGRTEAVPDGQGGILCFWNDFASVDNIRGQRIDADGKRLWGPSGVLVQAGTLVQQFAFAVISDGAGGAIIAWQDPRSGALDIYAQRIDADGNPLWGAGGMAICTATGDQTDVRLASDGSDGAWIVWTDARAGASTDIYARRISGGGVPQGVANGIAVCSAAGIQSTARITAPAGSSGCTIVWRDQRTDGGDIYAQRLDFSGAPAWTANGVVLCSATGIQLQPEVVNDGGLGIVAAWHDIRAGGDIYAQRLDSGGFANWTANGVVVSAAANAQSEVSITRDGAGGAVVVFTDYRNLSYDIYAQRIAIETGAQLWTTDGVPVCAELGTQRLAQVVADGLGGTYVTWYDQRQNDSGDIYAQRLTSYGSAQWTTGGAGVATSPAFEYSPTLVSAGAEGCIVQVSHSQGIDSWVAAQKVDRWGYLGGEPMLASVTDVPNDQGGRVKVSWLASPLDTDPLFGNVGDYLVLRSVPVATAEAAAALGMVTDSPEEAAAPSPGGHRRLLRVVAPSGATSFWESVASQAALHLASYSAVVATTGDSVAGSNPLTDFMVQARGWSGAWWNSLALAGYSVDDLAPATPAPFTGLYSGGSTLLNWGANAEPDLAHYRLYRGGPGFVPSPANRVAEPEGTTFSDAAGGPFVYKLTAVDSHGNESAAATLLPDGTLATDGAPAAVDFLAAPTPQPMRANAGARLRFGLARAGRAELALFDVQGRRVTVLVDADLVAGEHSVALSVSASGGALAPGIYVVRLTTPGSEATRRLIVVR